MSSSISLPFMFSIKANMLVVGPEKVSSTTYSGSGQITGLVRESGTPVRRRVNLHVRPKGLLIASVWSNADGVYVFKRIAKQYMYYIVCVDETGEGVQYPALVQDLITGDYDEKKEAVTAP